MTLPKERIELLAKDIACAVVEEISGHKGFDLYGLDEETFQELMDCLKDRIYVELSFWV